MVGFPWIIYHREEPLPCQRICTSYRTCPMTACWRKSYKGIACPTEYFHTEFPAIRTCPQGYWAICCLMMALWSSYSHFWLGWSKTSCVSAYWRWHSICIVTTEMRRHNNLVNAWSGMDHPCLSTCLDVTEVNFIDSPKLPPHDKTRICPVPHPLPFPSTFPLSPASSWTTWTLNNMTLMTAAMWESCACMPHSVSFSLLLCSNNFILKSSSHWLLVILYICI